MRIALGAEPKEVRAARDLMVVFDHETDVAGLAPNLDGIAALDTFAVIVTAPGREADFVSRFFAPWAGIDEDPVTGSAHCCLGPYWQKQLGKDEMMAFQASARGGVVRVRVIGNRVMLGGQAVTVMKGSLL